MALNTWIWNYLFIFFSDLPWMDGNLEIGDFILFFYFKH